MKELVLWLAWKVDHLCHRIIEWLDPISPEEIRRMLEELEEKNGVQSAQNLSVRPTGDGDVPAV